MYSVLKKILDNILSDIKNYGMFCPAKIYFNKETNLIEEYVPNQNKNFKSKISKDKVEKETTLFEILLSLILAEKKNEGFKTFNFYNIILIALHFISDLSFDELAKTINVSASSLKKCEHNDRRCTLDTLLKICTACQFDKIKIIEIATRNSIFDF